MQVPSTPAGPASGVERPSQVFFRYRGPDGRLAVTNVAADVPRDQQASAETVLLDRYEPRLLGAIDGRSCLVGAAVGLLVGVAVAPLLRRMPGVGRYAVGAVAAAAIAFGYLGYLRRSTGLGQGAVATPQSLIQDARKAVESMNGRIRERDDQLKQIELESRK